MTKIESAVDRLLALGYLRFVLESELRIARKELMENLCRGNLASELPQQGLTRERRLYRIDLEELIGERMSNAFWQIGGVLRAEGVPFESVKDRPGEEHYAVIIDGRPYSVYDAAEKAMGWTRSLAKRRFLEIANELLESVGSKERFYALNGADGFGVILLTSEMYNVLRRPDLKIRANWLPSAALELE